MSNTIKGVSVVIPTYNRASLLPRSIESVINQSYVNWELIVIDDCSTDNTKDVVSKFIEQDDRIRYFRNEKNMACLYSRLIGFDLAKYEWIANLDSDDELTKDSLKARIDVINNSKVKNLGLVVGYCYTKKTGKEIHKCLSLRGNVYREALQSLGLYWGGLMMFKKSIIYKAKDEIEKVKTLNFNRFEDNIFGLILLKYFNVDYTTAPVNIYNNIEDHTSILFSSEIHGDAYKKLFNFVKSDLEKYLEVNEIITLLLKNLQYYLIERDYKSSFEIILLIEHYNKGSYNFKLNFKLKLAKISNKCPIIGKKIIDRLFL